MLVQAIKIYAAFFLLIVIGDNGTAGFDKGIIKSQGKKRREG
jgi:hypothetical protein